MQRNNELALMSASNFTTSLGNIMIVLPYETYSEPESSHGLYDPYSMSMQQSDVDPSSCDTNSNIPISPTPYYGSPVYNPISPINLDYIQESTLSTDDTLCHSPLYNPTSPVYDIDAYDE